MENVHTSTSVCVCVWTFSTPVPRFSESPRTKEIRGSIKASGGVSLERYTDERSDAALFHCTGWEKKSGGDVAEFL